MLLKDKLFRAVCAVVLVGILSLSSFANPAYADTGTTTTEITTQEIVSPENITMTDVGQDIGAVMAITGTATAIGVATHGAALTVATITTTAPGILGMLGLGVTSTVALPVAGVVGATALAGYGVYRGMEYAHHISEQPSPAQ